MATDTRQVLIVGAGVTGLLTAVRCALAGHRVTVLDRGAIPNPKSSSFDQHRAVRALDPNDLAATRRATVDHHQWLQLEALLGSRFYRCVGAVTAWPVADVDAVCAAAAGVGLPVALVEPDKLPYMRFPADSMGVLEVDAGVLLADRVLRAAARWLAAHSAVTLLPWREVTAVDADTGRVALAGGEMLGADLVLIANGPWSRDLVDMRTVLHRQTMVYLRPPENLVQWWEAAPCAGRIGADGQAWLLPPGAGALLKISTAAVCREADHVDPVAGDPADDESKWAAQVMAASILADVDRYRMVAVKRCHYLVDADTGGALLVRMGPTVWARAASGGDGFRTAPRVADRIAEAVVGLAA